MFFSRSCAAVFMLAFCLHGAASTAHAQDTIIPPTTETTALPAPDATTAVPVKYDDKAYVVLQALDKITARVSSLVIKRDDEASFGSLKITARACKQAQPLERPESAAFLQILEQKPGEKIVDAVFSGWMFASSPSLSAMEHPIYDIWVTNCIDDPKKK